MFEFLLFACGLLLGVVPMAFFAGMMLGGNGAIKQMQEAKLQFTRELHSMGNDLLNWFKKGEKNHDTTGKQGDTAATDTKTNQPLGTTVCARGFEHSEPGHFDAPEKQKIDTTIRASKGYSNGTSKSAIHG